MTQPTAAMLVIGDEILSGRTRDSNMHHLAGVLTEKGIPLCEVRVVADDHAAIVAAARCGLPLRHGQSCPTRTPGAPLWPKPANCPIYRKRPEKTQ